MSLYGTLIDQLTKDIIQGVYAGGSPLPTEQLLCERHGLSRVTVRKALEELKKDGLISSVQGQGTVVADRRGGYAGSLDLIALVSATHNPFFASFMEHFEKTAEENGSLVLFKQDFQGDAFQSDQLFFRFVKKHIRNVVLWPQTDRIDFGLLRRLRTVGMNLVFFDQPFESDVADVVSVDHRDAVLSLVDDLRARTDGKLVFIGFHGVELPSETARERAFRDGMRPGDEIRTIPWRGPVEQEIERLFDELTAEGTLPCGLLCCNGPVGIAAAKSLRARGLEAACPLAAIDLLPDMAGFRMTAYRQPMKELAEASYRRLAVQSNQGEHWQAGTYLLRGDVVRL
ncbi:GntR family transcriptional regulator [Paenibacillus sp.]|uniref:GntR family transcriptional regulator n=1 Tax=Paenibacillus sp. TaxID=58172 RepID=UPI002D4ADAC6|nr:GntR family transcriptional regulator [Paenibacillus sp.]HZG55047.1 GntR family transcriptional regulator [Paenibacillus sp.]